MLGHMMQHPLDFFLGKPWWFHHHGLKMRLHSLDLTKQHILIKGSAAEVTIQIGTPYEGVRRWNVTWQVRHAIDCFASGMTTWTDDEFAAAFGVNQVAVTQLLGHQWLLELYGADDAAQRSFIRWKNNLNIPCPGTGHDGDPNVSVYLDEEMKSAARQLLGL